MFDVLGLVMTGTPRVQVAVHASLDLDGEGWAIVGHQVSDDFL